MFLNLQICVHLWKRNWVTRLLSPGNSDGSVLNPHVFYEDLDPGFKNITRVADPDPNPVRSGPFW